jgi:hypothetical protein
MSPQRVTAPTGWPSAGSADMAHDLISFFAMCAFLCAVVLWLPVPA